MANGSWSTNNRFGATYTAISSSTSHQSVCTVGEAYAGLTSTSYATVIYELKHSITSATVASSIYVGVLSGSPTSVSISASGYASTDTYSFTDGASNVQIRITPSYPVNSQVYVQHRTSTSPTYNNSLGRRRVAYWGTKGTAYATTGEVEAHSLGTAVNTWASYTSSETIGLSTQPNQYAAITANSSNLFVSKTVAVPAYKKMYIKLRTYSNANKQGIVLSSSSLNPNALPAPNGNWLTDSFTGKLAACSGNSSTTYTYTNATSSEKTLYLYFYTTSDSISTSGSYSGFVQGDVEMQVVTPTLTLQLNRQGGTYSGSGFFPAFMTVNQGANASDVPSAPGPLTRSPFVFLGYFDAASGGNKYFDSNLTCVHNIPYTSNSTLPLYAHWGNPIASAYFPSQYSCYCTSQAKVASVTDSEKSFTLWSTAPTAATGTISYIELQDYDGNVITDYSADPEGEEESSIYYTKNGNPQYLYVPQGTSSRNDIIRIIVYTSSGTTGGYPYEGMSTEYTRNLYIYAVTATSYDEIITDEVTNVIIQSRNCPASAITFTSSNIPTYFSIASDGLAQRVYFSNTTTKMVGYPNTENGLITWITSWSTTSGNSLASLGTTVTAEDYAELEYPIILSVTAGGGKNTQLGITSVLRNANNLESLTLSQSSGSIKYEQSLDITVSATYTSGASKDVTSSLSTSATTGSNRINAGDSTVIRLTKVNV